MLLLGHVSRLKTLTCLKELCQFLQFRRVSVSVNWFVFRGKRNSYLFEPDIDNGIVAIVTTDENLSGFLKDIIICRLYLCLD